MRSPPGRCGLAVILLVIAVAGLWAFGVIAPNEAAAQKKAAKDKDPSAPGATGSKTRSYTFTGLDIDGRLKTPQLLYFLNRMKAEFDTTTPTHRSFIPELKASTEEM